MRWGETKTRSIDCGVLDKDSMAFNLKYDLFNKIFHKNYDFR